MNWVLGSLDIKEPMLVLSDMSMEKESMGDTGQRFCWFSWLVRVKMASWKDSSGDSTLMLGDLEGLAIVILPAKLRVSFVA